MWDLGWPILPLSEHIVCKRFSFTPSRFNRTIKMAQASPFRAASGEATQQTSQQEPFVSCEPFLALPDDIIGVICRYLYPKLALCTRLALTCTKWLHACGKYLDYVQILRNSPASILHASASPSVVSLDFLGPPFSYEILHNILSSCKRLIFGSSSGHDSVGLLDFPLLANSFSNVQHIDLSSRVLHSCLEIWKYLKNIRSCSIPCEKSHLDAISRHTPPSLRSIEIHSKGSAFDMLKHISLAHLTCLEELRLRARLVNGALKVLGDDIGAIQKFQQLLPSHLTSMEHVHIVAHDGTSISLPQYLFCHSTSVADWQRACGLCGIFQHLPSIHDYLRWNNHLLSPSAVDRFQHLLSLSKSPVKLLQAPCNPITSSDIILGNVLFLASSCDSPVFVSLLNAIEWSDVTVEHLRDSQGFTPLHYFPKSETYWQQLYQHLKSVLPAILADDHNMAKQTVVAKMLSDMVRSKRYSQQGTLEILRDVFQRDPHAACANNDLVALLLDLDGNIISKFPGIVGIDRDRQAFFGMLTVAASIARKQGPLKVGLVEKWIVGWDHDGIFVLWTIMPEVLGDALPCLSATQRSYLFRNIIEHGPDKSHQDRIAILNTFQKYDMDLRSLSPMLASLVEERDFEFFWSLVAFGVSPIPTIPRGQTLQIPSYFSTHSLEMTSVAAETHFERLVRFYVDHGDRVSALYSVEAVCERHFQYIQTSGTSSECPLIDRLAKIAFESSDRAGSLLSEHKGLSVDALETLLFLLVGPWEFSSIDMYGRLSLANQLFMTLKAAPIEVAVDPTNPFSVGILKLAAPSYDFTPLRRKRDQAFLVAAVYSYTRAENAEYKRPFETLFDEICDVMADRKGLGSSWPAVREIFLAAGPENADPFRKMEEAIDRSFWRVSTQPLKSFNPTGLFGLALGTGIHPRLGGI